MKCNICENYLDYRNTSGLCRDCFYKHRPKKSKQEKLEKQYEWRRNNKKRVAVSSKRTYKKHRAKRLVTARNSNLKRKYGISIDGFNEMLEEQNYRCAICNKHQDLNSKYSLAVDHNHETGKVRELLCSNCNVGLGLFGDSEDILLKALMYLKRHAETP